MTKIRQEPQSVFLNIPFDKKYEPLFVTLIASVVCLGLKPRCVLEIREGGQGRLDRIQSLIESCDVSIHDLSRVGLPVRFNMPFELGLAHGRAKYAPRHEIIVLDSKLYRLDCTLSDYKGRDPLIHHNTCNGLVTCILDAFVTDGKPTPSPAVRRVAKLLRKTFREHKRQEGLKDMYGRAAYKVLVSAAAALAVSEGLIAP